MLEGTHIGLKVDVDTLRGTREGVPQLVALFKKLGVDATFYFSVGPDHTGRALRRVFRKGFAQKVARTSVLKHYGLKTLAYGVLLPGPDIGAKAGEVMRTVRDAGFEVGLHTYDHVRWQDNVAQADAAWTRREFELGMNAFKLVFGVYPDSHAAAGWQINEHGLALEREFGLKFASDTRGPYPFQPVLPDGATSCVQLPTTLPTFDEVLGLNGVTEASVAEAIFQASIRPFAAEPVSPAAAAVPPTAMSPTATTAPPATANYGPRSHVFTLHAELEGMLLIGAFEQLLKKWLAAGAVLARMQTICENAGQGALPRKRVCRGEVPGRSGLLAVQETASL